MKETDRETNKISESAGNDKGNWDVRKECCYRRLGDDYDLAGALMMLEYPIIREVLAAIFCVEIGLSADAASAVFKRALQIPEWQAAFSDELLAAATDPRISWIEMLSNERYEIIDASSEDEARDIAMSLLWESTFPGKPVPQP